MTRYSDAVELQKKIATKVIDRDEFEGIESICAVDVAYDKENAYCSAVLMSRSGKQVESASSATPIEYPYVPGLLMLREAPPIFHTMGLLKNDYDVLLVDGHGQLHPRKSGIACYVGVKLGKPTIGIAKSLLCGTVRADGRVELDGKVLGRAMGKGGKKVYVSVGHKISLETAVSLVSELGKGGIPEVMRLADANSKKEKGLTRI
jgi:deoxyribonuclease V